MQYDTCIYLIYIYIFEPDKYIYEINGCHMAYEGFPHICIGGTITWGERERERVECGSPTCDCATWGKYEENPHMPYDLQFSHIYIYIYRERERDKCVIWHMRVSLIFA